MGISVTKRRDFPRDGEIRDQRSEIEDQITEFRKQREVRAPSPRPKTPGKNEGAQAAPRESSTLVINQGALFGIRGSVVRREVQGRLKPRAYISEYTSEY